MGVRREFKAKGKQETVAMLDALRITASQIVTDPGIGANMLGR